MKRMVDDFRDYARTPPAVLEPLDLNGLIEEILTLYLAEDASDVIHATLAPNLPRVMGDPTQLRQVIHNLLQNAQDALADRGPDAPAPRIDVATEIIRYTGADGTAGEAVRLAIVDNGPGLCAENPGARLRTLRDVEGARHGPGPADGEKDHRRTRWPHRCPEPSAMEVARRYSFCC